MKETTIVDLKDENGEVIASITLLTGPDYIMGCVEDDESGKVIC